MCLVSSTDSQALQPETAERLVIANFYKFFSIPESDLDSVKNSLETTASGLDVAGLFILATEGLNGSVCGTKDRVDTFLQRLLELCNRYIENPAEYLSFADFKWGFCNQPPLQNFKVKVRQEIVTTRSSEPIKPEAESAKKLSPKEWHNLLTTKQDNVL